MIKLCCSSFRSFALYPPVASKLQGSKALLFAEWCIPGSEKRAWHRLGTIWRNELILIVNKKQKAANIVLSSNWICTSKCIFFLFVLMLPDVKTITVNVLINQETDSSTNYISSFVHSCCSATEWAFSLTFVL